MSTYATIITTDDYLLGALTLHKSLILTKLRYHLLVVDRDMPTHRGGSLCSNCI
jgi:hypothetical protein